MTGELGQFALSLLAVLLLVGIAHWAGFSAPPGITSHDEARDLARLAPGGFEPERIAIGRGGRGAIAQDHGGRLLLIRPHGAQFVPQLIAQSDLRLAGEHLLVRTATLSLNLDLGPDAAHWHDAALPA